MQNLQGKGVCFSKLGKRIVRQQAGYLLAGVLQTKSFASQRGIRQKRKLNYYDALALTPKATQSQIKSAYYELSKTYHPDVNKSEAAAAKFAEISEAYETLGNVQKRRYYDHGFVNPSGTRGGYHETSPGANPFDGAPGFGERPRAPPRGRTNTYNFDEFYRQHYGDSIDQKEQERQSIRKRQEELVSRKGDKTRGIFALGFVIGIVLAVLPFTSSHRRSKHDR